ncbi:pyruvate decarboxylase-like protein [Phyllosticta citribraziliensis]|uniref:Pyruvate decarboxylase n=1 Tax=Phyllosticta citribraziliensis TaxID=989973 RepID=A0ABR1L3H6_9PEZI
MSGLTPLASGQVTPDIRTSELKQPVDIAEYLFRRLHQVGVRSVHGLPGDYNLVALDYLPKANLNWVGNVNELNAGYAADGYARIKGISAVVTTFGVGELSAVNAIAGAYSEFVPIVHIVGYPSTVAQKNNLLLHHTLGNGNFNAFANMNREVSCAMAMLNDPHEAATLIDDAITKCYLQSRPVYVALPSDMVTKKVEGERLNTPLDLAYSPNHVEKEEYVVNVVLKYLTAAKNPVVLVDACAIRHRALKEVDDFVTKSGIPTFVTPMGKSAVNETLPNYGGVYAGTGSNAGVRERVEGADLIISIGAIKSDFNTTGFTYRTSQLNSIDFHSYGVTVKYSDYPGVRMNGVLTKVTERMGKLNIEAGPIPKNVVPDHADNSDPTITQAWFWPKAGQFLRDGDIVLTETGTANFGIWETRFPKDVTAISQVLWGSIGYATGSTQGAALAAKELGRKRTILFTGDGSFQLTAQEVSTMIRHDLNPIIFVICNDGYTIERCIHGWDAVYNDIQNWNYKDLPAAFGAKPDRYKTYQVKTKTEVEQLFADKEFNEAPCLRFVELYMPRDDAPAALMLTAEAAAKRNAD